MNTARIVAMVGAALLLIGAIGYLAVTTFGVGERKVAPNRTVDLGALPAITPTIDDSFLRAEPYTQLEQYGQYPVTPDVVGRENPFRNPEEGIAEYQLPL